MTTSINLLPWREALREDRKKNFLIALGVVVVAAAAILVAIHFYFVGAIAKQNVRNNYLNERIAILDRQLVEIRELRRQKEELAARMAVIQDLQGTRPVIVRLFDQFVRTQPEGVYYSRLQRSNDSVSIEGIADSNNTISTLMRELEASDWFGENPRLGTLTTIDSGADGDTAQIRFTLTVQITRPEQEANGNNNPGAVQ